MLPTYYILAYKLGIITKPSGKKFTLLLEVTLHFVYIWKQVCSRLVKDPEVEIVAAARHEF